MRVIEYDTSKLGGDTYVASLACRRLMEPLAATTGAAGPDFASRGSAPDGIDAPVANQSGVFFPRLPLSGTSRRSSAGIVPPARHGRNESDAGALNPVPTEPSQSVADNHLEVTGSRRYG